MTTAAIRKRLYNYIRLADDKKVKAIYTILEDQIVPNHDWSDNEDFVAELNAQFKRWEYGIDPSFPIAEVKASLEQLKQNTPGATKNGIYC